MRTIKVSTAKTLLLSLAEKTNEPLDHAGFGFMSEQLNTTDHKDYISQKYLYEGVFKKIEKLEREQVAEVRLNICKLDKIARFLGHDHYQEFEKSVECPIDDVLKGCLGTWYSFVRRNSGKGTILASPVKIYQEQNHVFIQLRGPNRIFDGKIELSGGCLFCRIQSEDGKAFQHVYKVGQCKTPNVLQGVFSGVTSSFEPIGGRAVLVREDASYHDLINEQVRIETINDHSPSRLQTLAQYFKHYESNNLRIHQSFTFDLDDLDEL